MPQEQRDTERPRDVFLRGCEFVAASLAPDGFQFARSGPHSTRKAGEFTHVVSFQSSHYNSAGEYIALWIHGTVKSQRLKRWRVEHSSLRGPLDWVAGGQIGNLAVQHQWLEWNLAEASDRSNQLDAAVAAVRRLALPYFEGFADVRRMTERLLEEELPAMDLLSRFEFLACFASMEAARAMAAAFLSRHPELVPGYLEATERLSAGSPARLSTGHPEVLAAIAVRYALGDLREA